MPVLLATVLHYSRLQTHFPSQPVFYASALAISMRRSDTKVAAPCTCWEHIPSCRSSSGGSVLQDPALELPPQGLPRTHHRALAGSGKLHWQNEQTTSNHQVSGKSCCYGFKVKLLSKWIFTTHWKTMHSTVHLHSKGVWESPDDRKPVLY